jgi:hypothetical protein
MIFQGWSRKADGFIPVKFPLGTIVRKEFPLFGVRKHCIDGKVLDIYATVHLTSSYVNQTMVSDSNCKGRMMLY